MMDLNFLYEDSGIQSARTYEKRHAWLQWFRLRRRKPNSDEEVDEIHDLILNVYEAMDDQARAVLLSLSKVVQDEDESIAIEEKIRAIVGIGHTLCCGHTQVKHATQLYTKLLVRALSHADVRMRLAAMIAIAEASIDNLTFQMKLNEIGVLSRLFDLMKTSMPSAGRTLDDINEDTKLVAWCCYTLVNVCVNCMPNILLLREMTAGEMDTLKEAAQMEIWRYVWRENYAQTILAVANPQIVHDLDSLIARPEPYVFRNHHITDNFSSRENTSRSFNRLSSSMSFFRCTLF